MKFQVQVPIKASIEKVWQVVTDIENSVDIISGIEKIEVLEKPEDGFVGFKWKETRTMFGKTATEVMWITEAKENDYYKVRAESHGAIYTSVISLAEQGDQTLLKMEFDGKAVTLGARVASLIFGFMFKGATKKALQKDLDDIKAAIENQEQA